MNPVHDSQCYQDWIGKHYVDDRFDHVPDEQNTLRRSDLPDRTRIIFPNTMVTMDFVPERLNVYIDDDSIVKSIKHG